MKKFSSKEYILYNTIIEAKFQKNGERVMAMEKLIEIESAMVAPVLDLLLQDKTTKRKIIWATDTYENLGEGFGDKEPITLLLLRYHPEVIKPRIEKSQEAQIARTRKRAEVFTPAWLCNVMNNYCDEDWFGCPGVFNLPGEDHGWQVTEGTIEFPDQKTWQDYVNSRRLEITCGEAPYLVSRYDVSTGDLMPLHRRIGILDRKLRIVNENTRDYDDWVKWALRALEATYGYEYQGDNLLVARINVLLTFVEYHMERWGRSPDALLLRKVANHIAWNLWQMDGLKDTVPLGKPFVEVEQMTMFSSLDPQGGQEEMRTTQPCKIYNWRRGNSEVFRRMKGGGKVSKKLFDYVIGNPPYNEDFSKSGENGNFGKPVYHDFMDAAFLVSDRVELIHPARSLFDAGSTPKAWNRKILNDPHFKVLHFEADAKKIFPNNDVKGGVAITYRDAHRDFGAIGTFFAYPELRGIVEKSQENDIDHSVASLVYTQVRYNLESLYADYPDLQTVIGSSGKDRRFRNNAFKKIPLFTKTPMNKDDIETIGLLKNKRVSRFIPKKYVDMNHENLEKWKVLVPRANGSGALGEVLSTPLIGEPLIGYTQSFIGIGAFKSEFEAQAMIKYVKSRFARVLLGVLKVTQDNDRRVWKLIPLQDFTSSSDIDWSQSIPDIDRQLYRKYGLNEKEIAFIETHVKEMA